MSLIAGHTELTVDDAVLHLLGLRQIALIRALETRGHAALRPIEADLMPPKEPDLAEPEEEPTQEQEPAAPQTRLPPEIVSILREARSHPEWSHVNARIMPDTRRDLLVSQMAQSLFVIL